MTPELDLTGYDLLPPQWASPAVTLLFGVAILGFGAAAAIALMFLSAHALARKQAHERAALAAGAAHQASPGPGRVVYGKVETDEEQHPIRLDVLQDVKDHTSKNSSWHTWKESSRTSRAVPFYLVSERGEPVYVEPGEDLLFADLLETLYPQHLVRQRVRRADVHVGDLVYAYGDLFVGRNPRAEAAGYRGGGRGLVLRPPRRGRMLLATDAIDDRYKARINFLRLWGALLTLAFLAFHALSVGPFLVTSFLGEHETATVISHREYVTYNKNSKTWHYVLAARAADGFAFEQEVPYATYVAALGSGLPPGVRVPMTRVGRSTALSVLGDRTSVHGAWLVLGMIAFAVAGVASVVTYGGKAAWYDRKRLDENGGTGHWIEVRPAGAVNPTVN